MFKKQSIWQSMTMIFLAFAVIIMAALHVHALEKVVVGTNAEYAPFEYLDENGNLTGFDIEIMEAIAKEEGFEIEWKDLPFDSLIGSMEAGDLQVIAAAIGPTEERAQSVDFSEIYYTGSQSIICRKGDSLEKLDQLDGLTVAVLEGATADLIVSGENEDFGKVGDINVKRFKNASTAVMELKNGGADAVMIDTIMAEIYCKETTGIEYHVVAGTENDTVLCITKGDKELKAKIDEGIAKIQANGTYDALYEKYFGGEETSGAVNTAADEPLGNGQTVVVGTNAEYAPFEYLDEDGDLTGFDIDLMKAIAEAENFEIEWKDLPFDSLIGSMEAGDLQVIAAAIGPTEERAQSVDFSEIYYTGSQSIICPEGEGLETLEQLDGKKVAVLEGATADLIVSGENEDFGEVGDISVKRFKNAGTAVMELKNGGVDAVMIDTIMAEIYCKETAGIEYHVVAGTENDTVFCLTKGDTELKAMIDAGIAKVTADGTYDALYEQYFGGDETSGNVAKTEEAPLGDGQTIIVGTNAEYAPFEYLDEDGNLTGFDIELMEEIAAKENFVINWKDLPFDSLIGSMEAGDIQVIAAAIGPTEERAQSVDFSEIYYTGSQSIIFPEGNEYSTLADLKGKKVAVLEGATADLIVSGENEDFGKAEDITVVRFKNASTAVMELKNGGADAVMIDTIMAEIYCNETEGIGFHKVDGTENDTVFCLTKGDEELANLINSGLAKVNADGTYDALYEKYFGGDDTGNVNAAEEEIAEEESTSFLATLNFIFIKENRWKYYVRGLGLTILVSLLSVVVGVLLGLIVAVARIDAQRKNKKTIFSMIASAYVDIIRGTPSVLQLMIIYFALFHSKFGLVAAVCSFGINSGAYVSEVIRGGIQSIDKGQMEAGRSLGLSYGDTLRFIIIPQAIKNILPALGNEFILLIKETSILGYIGMMDLTKASNYVLSRTYQMFIPLLAAGIIYYVIVKILSIAMQTLERRMRESD